MLRVDITIFLVNFQLAKKKSIIIDEVFGKVLLAHERQKSRKHGPGLYSTPLNSRETAMGVERQG